MAEFTEHRPVEFQNELHSRNHIVAAEDGSTAVYDCDEFRQYILDKSLSVTNDGQAQYKTEGRHPGSIHRSKPAFVAR